MKPLMKRLILALFVIAFFCPLPVRAERLSIAGPPLANMEQAVNFIKKSNPNPKLNCTAEEIVRLYYQEAGAEGIRPDVALCQALLETGFFRYGGDVKPGQNNFCGLGSVGGGSKGATFATPELGVRAHIQHLIVYSRKSAPKTAIVDPRYSMARKLPHIFDACKFWQDLDGRWARAGAPYSERILSLYQRMLATPPFKKPGQPSVKSPGDELTPDETKDKHKPESKKKKTRKSRSSKKNRKDTIRQ